MLEQRQQLERAEIHDVLSNDRRWQVLELLADESPRTLRTLADQIAAVEAGESPAPRQVRQSVYVTLHQNHLPKLDSLDIVRYDDVSKTVALGDRADDIDVYLEVVERGHLSWSEYYVGVVLVGLLATLASLLAVPAFVYLTPVTFAAGALLVLLVSLAAQIYQQGSPWTDRLRRDAGGD
ncbi:DUF7344 domain-containing protein [Halobacterium litoreum]|uniref:DUF7344 domain-containing protein n=1 Tax=Halobacterium litoreum TaxID=2039234 RepID=A0ABD5ND53_9EURY|nr:hypothetical protein [Halobacterium litoreum]UHH14065.1 hypothetical protein LT972_03465 [Halobacterium litoreum]